MDEESRGKAEAWGGGRLETGDLAGGPSRLGRDLSAGDPTATRRLQCQRPWADFNFLSSSPSPRPNRFDSPGLHADALTLDAESRQLTFIMSLLRACQQAVSKHAVGRTVLTSARAYSTTADATIPQTTEKQDTEVAEAPHRDVVTADIVSGAPSESRALLSSLFVPRCEQSLQGSSVTALSASSSPRAARPRAGLASPTVGG